MTKEKDVANIRAAYPKGTRVILVRMDDPQSPPKGEKGTVNHVDDVGTIHVLWDNGSTLGAVYKIDEIKKDRKEQK